jgi:large subunit ribosomal protein L35
MSLMPKMKTHKGWKKRVKITARGKVLHKRSGAGHLMSGKSGDRVRRLRRTGQLTGATIRRVKAAIGG